MGQSPRECNVIVTVAAQAREFESTVRLRHDALNYFEETNARIYFTGNFNILSHILSYVVLRCRKITVPLCRGDRCTNCDVQTAGKTAKTFETLRIYWFKFSRQMHITNCPKTTFAQSFTCPKSELVTASCITTN